MCVPGPVRLYFLSLLEEISHMGMTTLPHFQSPENDWLILTKLANYQTVS